ncbi:TonB-dependent receptor [Novosphingopyxis sp. YJ-S2-01]|uniref:TonB-dependent receptor n=1 Tax=Novosphingopyxis sp. YJ-S2-01 TaxID=2794021 RepID=UPI0018DE1195|nr:TonB-dependent receptor [Novosphingopyxis sp. YJ-S2-01]MBH9538716.1 TonB-dependent receptor [Novosphingopyxis sp. YJ-S2-01]
MKFAYFLLAGTVLTSPLAAAEKAPDVPAAAPDAAAPAPVSAPQAGTTAQTQDAYHDEPSTEIIVTAPFQRNRLDVLSGTSVLTGTELTRELRPTIGDTLAKQPGVSATSFGPNASRPVLRGFQGDRVRILTDGIGSFDVSNTSVDHAVVINPLTADRIEVLRGPSALLYGSSAIGGVVNVIDSRIPRRVPESPLHAEGLATYGSAADERAVSGAVDVPFGGKFVAHADASYTKTGDLETGGYILAPALRAEAAASADPEIRALADLKGKLPNSAAETSDLAAGLAFIDEGGSIGFSVNQYDSLYGVPIRYALQPGEDAEAVRLDVKQTRADLRAEVDTGGGFLRQIKLRAGFADYEHSEIEDTGEVGTTFYNQGIEARLELVQARRGNWEGAIGGQMLIRDFNVVGEEKFLPRNRTQQYGIFTLQSFDLGPLRAEAGGRYEHSILNAFPDTDLGNPFIERRFDAFSGSLGASYGLSDAWRLGLSGTYTERAPAAEELFPNGPHAGTQAFEIGNPNFDKERSKGLEASLRGKGDGYNLSVSGFYNWFDNFIYDQQTGELEDGLPVYQFMQAEARYYGFEVDASARLAQFGEYAINVDGIADYVHATIVDVGPAPRIPPLRLLGGIEAQSDRLTGRIEAEYNAKQTRVAPIETPTDDFTLVNASLAFRPFDSNRTQLIVSANNIFDVTARRAASFLKDYAPLAGRDFRVSLRLSL